MSLALQFQLCVETRLGNVTKKLLTAALLGNATSRAMNPALPITPKEIANDAIACWRAGAPLVHIHVRDPESELPSMDIALYREVVDRIRDVTDELVINLTTGTGGRFVPTPGNPAQAGPGTNLSPPERRVAHIAEIKPDVATLDLNTMWFGADVVINTPENVRIMAAIMQEVGTKPEIELFDSGDIRLLHDLIASGDLAAAPLCSLVLGVKYGFDPSVEAMVYAKSQLPKDATWTGFSIGRHSYPMMAASLAAGGHARIGLEDATRLDRKTLAPSNAAMVTKAKHIMEELGYELATASEAREMLGLRS